MGKHRSGEELRASAMAVLRELDDPESPSADVAIIERKMVDSQAEFVWALNQIKIMKMVVAGHSYTDIAADVGLAVSTVRKNVSKFLEKTATKIGTEELRQRELLRYEYLTKKLWEKIDPEDPETPMSYAALDKLLTIAAHRRSLMGLDKPVDKTINHNIGSTKQAEATADKLAKFMDLADRLSQFGSGRIEVPGAIDTSARELLDGDSDSDTDYDADDDIETGSPNGAF